MSSLQITSVESFLVQIAKRSKTRSTTWYRGQLNKFPLQPSLYRHSSLLTFSDAVDKEWELRSDFTELASIYYDRGIESGLRGIMQMQHYRVPTRLLDWTRNPLVALFFALTEAQASSYAEDTSIWLLDPNEWNKRALGRVGGPAHPLGVNDPEVLSYVGIDKSTVLVGDNPITIRGHSDNSRIAAQQGAFVLLGNAPTPLETMDQAAKRLRIGPSVLLKTTIPASKARDMLDNLLAMGITDDFVYPDLEGVVSHIRRKAGYSR
jgi:hypothetical protein